VALDPKELSKIIKESGIDYRESGQSYKFECPRCNKAEKLFIRKSDGRFICFYCSSNDNFKGRAEFALRELTGLPLGELRRRLYGVDMSQHNEYLDVQLADFWNEDEESFSGPAADLPVKEVAWPPDFVGMDKPTSFVKGARYLHGRGITPEHVRTYDIKYSPAEKRVIFPVKVDGKLVGWQARYIDRTEFVDEQTGRLVKIPKILTSLTLQNSGGRYLMFQDRLNDSEHAVLSEGPVTAIKAHRCGGNVASMGKAVTPLQLEVIARKCKRLYLALDTDAAEDIMRIVRDTHEHMTIYLMATPQNFENLEDPNNERDNGDLGEDEVFELFRSAKPEPMGKIYISLGNLLVH
jgi:hypothetical protein